MNKKIILLGVLLITLTGCFDASEDDNTTTVVNLNTPAEIYDIDKDPTVKSDGEHYITITHPEANDTVEMPFMLTIETEGIIVSETIDEEHELYYDIYFDEELIKSGRYEEVEIELEDLKDPEEFLTGEHSIKVVLSTLDNTSDIKSEISDTVTFFVENTIEE